MRLRNQLLILVFSVLIPAFLASILAVWYVYKEEQAAQEKGMTEAARAFSLLVENELYSKAKILQILANSPALVRNDLREFYDYAKTMAPNPETTIILLDKRDHQLINTRLPFGSELPKRRPSNINEVMERYGETRPLVSDVFFAPVGKRYDFIIQVPVMQGAEIRYFLVMGVNVAEIQPLLVQQNLPARWLGVIVDRKGVIVARSREPDRFIGKASEDSVQKLFSSQSEGIVRTVTLDGVPVKTFFNRVTFSDWTIVLSIPEAELRRTPIRVAAFLALFMAILLGASFIIARSVAARVIVRMDQLGLSAETLGRGEEVWYQHQGLVEIDSVGDRITDASKQIRQSKLELEQRVAQAVAENERAQRSLLQAQKLEALGRLTGGIAHDFNNILQTLSTSLQLIPYTNDKSRIESLLATCEKAIDRATILTGQMRSFGKVQDTRLQTVRLTETICTAMPLLKSALPSSIDLVVQPDEALWPVTIDPLQFELALLNIVINARDAMVDGGYVKIAVYNKTILEPIGSLAQGDYVSISISDNGSGMSAEVLSKALDPFFTTKGLDKGSGLGLPQAYGFATQANGTLILDSVEGKGTTVTMYVPRTTLEVSTVHVEEGVPQKSSGRGTLLFVEDDSLVRVSVEPALRAAGFQVLIASSGEEAVAYLESNQSIDLVFSDIVMPGNVSGIDLARIVKSRFPHIQIVLATGYTETRVDMAGVRLLAKPYKINEAINLLTEAV